MSACFPEQCDFSGVWDFHKNMKLIFLNNCDLLSQNHPVSQTFVFYFTVQSILIFSYILVSFFSVDFVRINRSKICE